MVPENSNSLTHFTRNDGEYILTTVQGMKINKSDYNAKNQIKLISFTF